MNREPQQIYEELLVLQSQAGNSDAIAKMVAIWHPRLVRYAGKITGEPESANDAVQETWLAILKGIGNLNDPERFRSWAFRIVHNKSQNVLRRKISQRNVLNELSQTHPRTTAELSATADAGDPAANRALGLRQAVSQLPSEDQQVLALYYEENLSIKEIELVTGATVSAIKSKLERLRKKLKSILERTNNE